MTTTTITRTTLLNVLANSPNGELAAGEAIRLILAATGCEDTRDTRKVVANVRFNAKSRGLVEDAGYGTWRITDAGRAVAAGAPVPAATGKPGPGAPATGVEETPAPVVEAPTMARAEETAAEAPVAETAPAAETPAVSTPAVETAPAKRRLKVANAPAATVEVPPWLADEDIRAMAVEATDCFGAWSAKSAECGKCPLAGWCRNAKASTLALLASKLTTETPATPEAVRPSVAKLDAAVSTANAPDAPRAAVPDAGGLTMKARHDGVCAVSGRPIKVGDSVRYKAGLGIYHAGEVPPTA